jgi:hypothetical protein
VEEKNDEATRGLRHNDERRRRTTNVPVVGAVNDGGNRQTKGHVELGSGHSSASTLAHCLSCVFF